MKIKNNILFSIIIPTHNRAYIIEKCINSILNQTYANYELIIVDDHSTDNTFDIINNFKDNRIKYLKLTDKKRRASCHK